MTQDNLEKLFETSAEPTVFVRMNGTILWQNRIACELWGDEMLSMSLSDYVGLDTDREIRSPDAELTCTRDVSFCGQRMRMFSCLCKEEEIFVLRFRACDILTREAAAVSAATDGAVRSVLSSMLNDTSSLSQSLKSRSDLSRYPGAYRRSVYQMLRISGDLSLIASIRDDSVPDMRATETVDALVREYADKAAGLVKTVGIDLTVSQTPARHVFSRIDAGLFERAFFAMVSNCCQHEGCRRVDVRVRFEEDMITITLKDDGAYAPADSIFLQLREARYRAPSLPLYLPLADAVAQYHNGTVLVSGSEATGNIVSFRMPRVELHRNQLNSPAFLYDGGIDKSLVELSPILPDSCYIR